MSAVTAELRKPPGVPAAVLEVLCELESQPKEDRAGTPPFAGALNPDCTATVVGHMRITQSFIRERHSTQTPNDASRYLGQSTSQCGCGFPTRS